jgi:hypothetical protein
MHKFSLDTCPEVFVSHSTISQEVSRAHKLGRDISWRRVTLSFSQTTQTKTGSDCNFHRWEGRSIRKKTKL